MEGHPPTRELVETLISATGYPRAAFRTFVEHGELDQVIATGSIRRSTPCR